MAIDRVKVRKEAEGFLAKGRVDKAIDAYRLLLEDNPRDMPLMNTVGDLLSQAGRNAEAVDLFKKLAIAYERDGFAPKATAILKKTVRLAPEDMDIAQRLADLYRQTGMIRDAVATHLQVAEHFTKKGLIKRALEEFAKVVDLDPKNLKNKVKLADLYNKEGMKDRAAEIYLEVAEALGVEGMHAEAFQILERAKTMTTAPQVFMTQSRLSVIQNDYNGAAAHLRQGLEANPRSSELLEALAEIELRANNPDRALEALGQIPQMPEKALPVCERALRQLVQAGRSDEGLRLFSAIGRELARRGIGDGVARVLKSAMQGSMTVEAWTFLAETAHQSGQRGEQILALQNAHALAAKQNDTARADNLKKLLADLGASPDNNLGTGQFQALGTSTAGYAVQAPSVEEITRHGETEVDPIKRMKVEQFARQAEAFTRTGSNDRAVDAYKQALQIDPANFTVIEAITAIHRQSGMLGRAQQQYLQSAQALHGLGRIKDVAVLLDKAEELFPGSTRIHRRTMGLPDYQPGKATIPPGAAPAAPAPPPPAPAPMAPPTIALEMPGASDHTVIAMPAPAAPPEPPQPIAAHGIIPLEVPGYAPAPPAPLPPTPAAPPPAEFEPLALSPGDLEWGEQPAAGAVAPPPAPPRMPAPIPAAAPLPPPPPAIPEELASLLSDIDFQLDYGSPEEAKIELDAALKDFPGHPELTSRLERAEAALAKLGHAAKATAGAEDDFTNSFFDLTDVLGTALMDTGEGEEMHDATRVVEKVQSVEELFSAFREGVEQQVKADDYDTHYNLGIAYKEMMLLEPAIEEFKFAMRDPERTLECCSMLSICEQATGNLDGAAEWLKKGIEAPGFPPEDSIGLRYDLGELYLQMGHNAAAQEIFRQVHSMDPEYRDVASRLQ
ncbi:MAG TPA: tetratricopeptide repeat protein [Holophagaceae bacterium]|nr:tetratricopeptide repeat protein [Holophagaceae bacterium]